MIQTDQHATGQSLTNPDAAAAASASLFLCALAVFLSHCWCKYLNKMFVRSVTINWNIKVNSLFI